MTAINNMKNDKFVLQSEIRTYRQMARAYLTVAQAALAMEDPKNSVTFFSFMGSAERMHAESFQRAHKEHSLRLELAQRSSSGQRNNLLVRYRRYQRAAINLCGQVSTAISMNYTAVYRAGRKLQELEKRMTALATGPRS